MRPLYDTPLSLPTFGAWVAVVVGIVAGVAVGAVVAGYQLWEASRPRGKYQR